MAIVRTIRQEWNASTLAAKANYVSGVAMLICSVVVAFTCEMGGRVPRIEDSALQRMQYFTGDLAIAGVIAEGAIILAVGHAAVGNLAGTLMDARMMMFMFSVLSITYLCMAHEVPLVHEFSLASAYGQSRPVYTLRYIEWTLTTPVLSLSGARGCMCKDSEKANWRLNLRASAFNIGASCIDAWVGSVCRNHGAAWFLIVLCYISHVVACWETLPFAWRIRHTRFGYVKAFMLCTYMLINTIYSVVYCCALFDWISPLAEQKFWACGDITSKYIWAISLTQVRDAAWREELRIERIEAADEAKQEEILMRKIVAAVAAVEELTHPMILMPGSIFLEQLDASRIPELQEEFKIRGTMRCLETMDEVKEFKAKGNVIIFFSYECLRWGWVAPGEVQLRTMKASIREACEMYKKPPEEVFVWLDCFSIPQKNPFLKAAAINAIYVFASIPDMMIITCPRTQHESTKLPADSESLKLRFWCRVESLAYFCQHGVGRMFLNQDTKLEPLPKTWIDDICCIYEANTTCCRIEHSAMLTCDRESVVLPLLALYADIYSRVCTSSKLSAKDEEVWALISRRKDSMFPKTFSYRCGGGRVVERDLFGQMVERVERLVAEGRLCIKGRAAELDKQKTVVLGAGAPPTCCGEAAKGAKGQMFQMAADTENEIMYSVSSLRSVKEEV